jgi:hypothetical protein
MSSSIGRRVAVLGGIAMLATVTFASTAPPASAATKNPCKVLKRSEIQQAFGAAVSSGKHGVSTAVSKQCEYNVAATGDRPSGTVVVHVMTTGAKPAYKGLKKKADTYAPLEGVPDALWSEKLHVVNVLKGKVLLGVQGGFTITDPLPVHFYDDQTPLAQLAQTGAARV